jgi:hypothetical protein
MIKSFKEFLNESYYGFSGTWEYTLELEDVMRQVISDFLIDHEHLQGQQVDKLADGIYDQFNDWYDENTPQGQEIYDIDIEVPYSGEDFPGSYDEAPYYDCDINGDIKYDKKIAETFYNQAIGFFDVNPDYADMKEFFTLDELMSAIVTEAEDKFETAKDNGEIVKDDYDFRDRDDD